MVFVHLVLELEVDARPTNIQQDTQTLRVAFPSRKMESSKPFLLDSERDRVKVLSATCWGVCLGSTRIRKLLEESRLVGLGPAGDVETRHFQHGFEIRRASAFNGRPETVYEDVLQPERCR